MKKVNASTDTNEIKDLIEEEYQNNFVVFTNNNKNEIDEQFQLVQSKIISISPSNEEVIKTIFEPLQNKVMEFSNNDLQTKNKIIQIDFKSIKNIFQHFEDEIKNKIENDTDVLFTFNNFRKKIKSLMLKINENNTKNIDVFRKLYFEKIQQNKECIKDIELENIELNNQKECLQKTIASLNNSIIDWSTRLETSLYWVTQNKEFLNNNAILVNKYYNDFIKNDNEKEEIFNKIQNDF